MEDGDQKKDYKSYEEKIQRYTVLLSVSQHIYDRLDNNINQLKSRFSTLIGFLLSILSLVSIFIIYLLQNGWRPLPFELLLLGAFSVFISESLYIALRNFLPQDYFELDIFKEKRFEELRKMSLLDIYSDIIYWLRENYKDNLVKNNKMAEELKCSTILFLIATLCIVGILIVEVIL